MDAIIVFYDILLLHYPHIFFVVLPIIGMLAAVSVFRVFVHVLYVVSMFVSSSFSNNKPIGVFHNYVSTVHKIHVMILRIVTLIKRYWIACKHEVFIDPDAI